MKKLTYPGKPLHVNRKLKEEIQAGKDSDLENVAPPHINCI
jgi:hypothetical protein